MWGKQWSLSMCLGEQIEAPDGEGTFHYGCKRLLKVIHEALLPLDASLTLDELISKFWISFSLPQTTQVS